MNQLDRLEALAEEIDSHKESREVQKVLRALPDLIRVARAAKAVRVENHADYGVAVVGLVELTAALAPLYRETES